MTQQRTTIHCGDNHSGGLSGEFWLDGDRFAQRVVWQRDASHELLRSREPSEPFAGPAFQEVYCQATPPGGQIAFLTGMADSRYWSASVEASAPGAPARLAFDLASRAKGRQGHVAAEYDLGEGVDATLESGELRLTLDGGLVATLRPTAIEGRPTAQLMLARRVVMLAPGEAAEGDPRWAFEVCVHAA